MTLGEFALSAAVGAAVPGMKPESKPSIQGSSRVEQIARLAGLGNGDKAIAELLGGTPQEVARQRAKHRIDSGQGCLQRRRLAEQERARRARADARAQQRAVKIAAADPHAQKSTGGRLRGRRRQEQAFAAALDGRRFVEGQHITERVKL